MGSEVIKIALFDPLGNYPFNSPDWPPEGFTTLLEMAKHPYYTELWQMPQFRTYVLIAYSTVGGTSGGDISYWVKGITPAQQAEETRQASRVCNVTPSTSCPLHPTSTLPPLHIHFTFSIRCFPWKRGCICFCTRRFYGLVFCALH